MFKLLTLSLLLLYHHPGDVVKGPKPKPINEMSADKRATYLKTRLDFTGCYSAVFRVQKFMLTPHTEQACKETCVEFQSAWSTLITSARLFSNNVNTCIKADAGYHSKSWIRVLEKLDGDVCERSQCVCGLNISVHNILLSTPKQVEKRRKYVKSRDFIPEMDPHGTKHTPYSCNASGFAQWLQARLNEPTTEKPIQTLSKFAVTFTNVVLDLVCDAFTGRFPAGAATPEGACELLKSARHELKMAKHQKAERKAQKADTVDAEPEVRPKKRPKKNHKCSARPASAESLSQLEQTCPAPETDVLCNAPRPNEATFPTSPVATAQMLKAIDEDFWKDLLENSIEELPPL
jgi:hypothetical protein